MENSSDLLIEFTAQAKKAAASAQNSALSTAKLVHDIEQSLIEVRDKRNQIKLWSEDFRDYKPKFENLVMELKRQICCLMKRNPIYFAPISEDYIASLFEGDNA